MDILRKAKLLEKMAEKQPKYRSMQEFVDKAVKPDLAKAEQFAEDDRFARGLVRAHKQRGRSTTDVRTACIVRHQKRLCMTTMGTIWCSAGYIVTRNDVRGASILPVSLSFFTIRAA